MAAEELLPVYKVGLVVVREDADEPRVLLIQPEPDPKKSNYDPSSTPPFVLPRGSRQVYVSHPPGEGRDAYEDIRDDADARRLKHYPMEPYYETLAREAYQEAGVPRSVLEKGDLRTMGARDYRSSPDHPPKKIQWYVLPVNRETAAEFKQKPEEARAVRWVTLEEMHDLVMEGKAREGYADIVAEAFDRLKKNDLPVVILESSPLRSR